MRKHAISAVLAICAALGWWGALYPEFTLLEGTYGIVYEEDATSGDETSESATDAAALYWNILNADSSRIRFKSRLFTVGKTLQEQRREIHESGDQQ
ncbi:MAG: hypothetical protein NC079_11905 [Clostridium sp.]|nr:hypothetical protein [Acetatifactor muris]MCM1528199.1 hypothetical protein [Bacteroides sp.]MCM1564294.1 hypothetical protein [Clostridium sp.]